MPPDIFFIKEGGKTSLPEALAALRSVLSAFLMLQRIEVLQKEVPNELSRCGKKSQRVCTQAHTLVSINVGIVEQLFR